MAVVKAERRRLCGEQVSAGGSLKRGAGRNVEFAIKGLESSLQCDYEAILT